MSYSFAELYRNGVPPVLEEGMSREAWEAKRERIRETWTRWIGGVPEKVSAQVDVAEETRFDDHRRLRISYSTVYGDRITAYLLLPNELQEREDVGKWPAVLAMHPTHESGKDNVATHEGRENRMYGLELVRRGYVVLAPDLLTAGDRIYPGRRAYDSTPFYEQFPDWSTVGKNIIDHIQGVEALCSLGYVDADRIGAIGHSFGAYNAYFLAPFDSRIKAVVASCGVCPFARTDEPEHWGVRPFPYTHLPRINEELAQDRVPFDFNEVIALCAPTPLMLYGAQADHIFPHWQAVAETHLDVAKLYKWLGVDDRYFALMGAGGHDFPPAIRLTAYHFFDRWLKS
ncbi:alpha/beta hydrolase family protein [Paenibacillus koleovorans]|uniref:alpha/beta hydrolase family protein n=1 Tax=Paenibacillus koleovorans TaxID=121608 RepID=UPI000FD87871|nr:alpha/beta fold hydrolase [Paenibacillus koleovorans]